MPKKYLEEYESSFTPRLLMEEASRCLLCHDAPCSKACPAGTDPAKFIRSVRFKNIKGAAETVRINNPLGAICARVCPTERYCQLGCSRSGIDKPIDIGRIQRYITDYEDVLGLSFLEEGKETGKKVAIIGGGPGALSAAALLRSKGHAVDIFEKEKELGGYLRYGIPEYRLPNEVVNKEVKRILDLGVKAHLGVEVDNKKLEELKKDYDAVVLAIGGSKGKMLPMFEGNKRVITAVDLLKEIKTNKGEVKLPNHVLVIGGGDVAMDVVTSLKLLGVERVSDVVYEEFSEFKASKKELSGAQENNVSIIDGYIPVAVNDNEVTFKHRFLEAELKIKADCIVLAVGQVLDAKDLDVKFERGEVDAKGYRIEGSNVFFVGDISHNEKTVVYAVRGAKEMVFELNRFLGGR